MRRAGQHSWRWPGGARDGRALLLLELHGCEIAQGRVQPPSIVELVDEVEKPRDHVVEALVVAEIIRVTDLPRILLKASASRIREFAQKIIEIDYLEVRQPALYQKVDQSAQAPFLASRHHVLHIARIAALKLRRRPGRGNDPRVPESEVSSDTCPDQRSFNEFFDAPSFAFVQDADAISKALRKGSRASVEQFSERRWNLLAMLPQQLHCFVAKLVHSLRERRFILPVVANDVGKLSCKLLR